MSKLSYFVGRNLNKLTVGLLNSNYKLLRFIPNGRRLALDIKRSGVPINTIFDVGANVGQTCLPLTKAFPKSTIYSFEPVPETYNQLKVNTKDYPSIRCINLALGDKKESLQILLHEDTEVNSLKNIAEHDEGNSVSIEVNTARNFCKDNGIGYIDLLKIDTEGFELEVLKGFDNSFLKENVKFIYAETGFDKTDTMKTHYSDLAQYLGDLGFVTSFFYEPFFWGKGKLRLGFCNVLFTNTIVLNK